MLKKSKIVDNKIAAVIIISITLLLVVAVIGTIYFLNDEGITDAAEIAKNIERENIKTNGQNNQEIALENKNKLNITKENIPNKQTNTLKINQIDKIKSSTIERIEETKISEDKLSEKHFLGWTQMELTATNASSKISIDKTKVPELVPTKTAYRNIECTQEVGTHTFNPGEKVYYKLEVKNNGKARGSADLTDKLPATLSNYKIESKVRKTNDSKNDINVEAVIKTENQKILNWKVTDLRPGEVETVVVSGIVKNDVEYIGLDTKISGEETKIPARLFVRLNGEIPFEDGTTHYAKSLYTASLGTVYLTQGTQKSFETITEKQKDIYYLIERNNEIVNLVNKGISKETLAKELNLKEDQVVIWYVSKLEPDGYHIDGVIRNISDLKTITNTLTMVIDNNKKVEVKADISLTTISIRKAESNKDEKAIENKDNNVNNAEKGLKKTQSTQIINENVKKDELDEKIETEIKTTKEDDTQNEEGVKKEVNNINEIKSNEVNNDDKEVKEM